MQFEQVEQGFVQGYAKTDGFALRMADAAGHFLGGLQDKSVGPRCGRLEQAVLAVVDAGGVGQFGQVTTQ